METINMICNVITELGFPIACVIGLAWYSKSTTDKVILLTEKVTDALVSSTNAVEQVKDVLQKLIGRE